MSGLDDERALGSFDESATVEAVERVRFRRPALRRSADGRHGHRGGSQLAGIGRLAGLVAVVIAAVVVLASWLAGSSGRYVSYVSGIGALAQSSREAGSELAHVLESVTSRTALEQELQALAAREQQAYDQAQLIRPPGPLREIHQELLAAVELRATGLADLGQVLANVGSSTAGTVPAADALATQARLLTASDVVWGELYQAPAAALLRARGVRGVVVPSSRFVANGDLLTAPAFLQLLQRFQGILTQGPQPLLKPGSTGTAVSSWQKQLNRWLRTRPGRAQLAITGVFDPPTEAATTALQQAAGVTADGIAGPATRQALTHELARTG